MKTTLYFILTLLAFLTLALVPNSFAQDDSAEYIVRVIYFHPKDRVPQSNIDTVLDGLIKQTQQFYADEMERHGFGNRTFRLETAENNQLIVHRVTGKFNNRHYYDAPSRIGEAAKEVFEQFDQSKNIIYLIWVDLHDPIIYESQVGGSAGGDSFRGAALIGATNFDRAPGHLYIRAWTTIAHELGHAFGLGHDFRDDHYIMSYGDHAIQDQLSHCAAEWLDVHRYFNTTQNAFAQVPTIEMLPPTFVSPPNTIRLRFEITHSTRIHQAQLHTNSFDFPGEFTLTDYKSLNRNSGTIEFVTTELARGSEHVDLRVIDEHGNFSGRRFPIDMTDLLPDSELVLIPDTNLAASIRESLGLAPGTPITQLDMLGLGSLEAGKKQIADLTGLQHATNLRRVDLNENQIVDLTPLAGLTQLKSLLIIKNTIRDVSPLAELTQLTEFWIWDNQISDISPLAGLTNLTTLRIGSNQISDISPLTGLTNLRNLSAGFNQISDISPLTGLMKLGELSLRHNQITDVRPIAGLLNLGLLELKGNPIEDFSPLRTLLANNPNLKIDIDIPDPSPLAFNPATIADQTFAVGKTIEALTLPKAVGGTTPYTYSISGLPAGLQFDKATRVLSGTPTTAGTTTATYTATDAANGAASLTFTITVRAKPTFTPSVVADQTFTVGEPVNLTLPVATGGTPPYTYTLTPLPEGLSFDETRRVLSGTPTTETETTTTTYTAMDAANASASLTFTIEVIEGVILDVNGDGQVTVLDLAIVALFYGTQVPADTSLPADVNADSVVNVLDLTAVAQGIDAQGGTHGLSLDDVAAALEAAAAQAAELEAVAEAPARFGRFQNVAEALVDVKHLSDGDVRLGSGVIVLEALMRLLSETVAIPERTALLPNYPNPFNPETWIPYHLSKDAAVMLTIYDTQGIAVRTLTLGHQPAGVYRSKHRAAYWDGRNEAGEKVSSGVYFYTLTADDFNATRKMLIRK